MFRDEFAKFWGRTKSPIKATLASTLLGLKQKVTQASGETVAGATKLISWSSQEDDDNSRCNGAPVSHCIKVRVQALAGRLV